MATVSEGVVKVGDVEYRWSVLRHPCWTRGRTHDTPTLLGLAILVERMEPSHRQLLLEFEPHESRHRDMRMHQRFKLPDSRLLHAIESAMEAGWDPDSRGKRFVFEAGPLQPR